MIRDLFNIPKIYHILEGFSIEDLKRIRQEWGNAPLRVFTEREFDFLQFAPSLLDILNSHLWNNGHTITELPIDSDQMRKQFEADLIGQYTVLEASLQHGYYNDPGFIDSKARAFTRLMDLALTTKSTDPWAFETKYPAIKYLHKGKITCPQGLLQYHPTYLRRITNKIRLLYQLKQTYNGCLEHPKWMDVDTTEFRVLEPVDPGLDGLVKQLQERFRKDIDVVLFGSATYNPDTAKDYDVIVRADKIRERYFKELADSPITHEGKNVDIIFTTVGSWWDFVKNNPFSIGLVKHGIVLHGSVLFPELNRHSAIKRSLARSAGRLITLHNIALNWAGLFPEELIEKEGLVASMEKTPGYVLRSLLELEDFHKGVPHHHYTNDEVNERLEELISTEYQKNTKPTDNIIQQRLYKAMVLTSKVVDAYHNPTWVHNHTREIAKIQEQPPGFTERLKLSLEIEKESAKFWRLSEIV